MYKKYILVILSLMFTIFSLSNSFAQNKLTASVYAEKVSDELNINKDKIYYLAEGTGSLGDEYLKNGFSLLTFINGDKSANFTIIQNTCGISDITKKIVLEYLSSPNQFENLIYKNLITKDILEDDGQEIIAVLFYRKDFAPILGDYVKKLKQLEKKEGISFIILTLEGKNEIEGVEDIIELF